MKFSNCDNLIANLSFSSSISLLSNSKAIFEATESSNKKTSWLTNENSFLKFG